MGENKRGPISTISQFLVLTVVEHPVYLIFIMYCGLLRFLTLIIEQASNLEGFVGCAKGKKGVGVFGGLVRVGFDDVFFVFPGLLVQAEDANSVNGGLSVLNPQKRISKTLQLKISHNRFCRFPIHQHAFATNETDGVECATEQVFLGHQSDLSLLEDRILIAPPIQPSAEGIACLFDVVGTDVVILRDCGGNGFASNAEVNTGMDAGTYGHSGVAFLGIGLALHAAAVGPFDKAFGEFKAIKDCGYGGDFESAYSVARFRCRHTYSGHLIELPVNIYR